MTPNYKLAAKYKYRFASSKGQLSADDLFNLDLNELDAMAQTLNKSLKEGNGDSFIPGASTKKVSRTDENKLAILIDVIQTKVADEKKRKDRQENAAKVAHLRQVLAGKIDDDLRKKSTDEILEMLSELGEDED